MCVLKNKSVRLTPQGIEWLQQVSRRGIKLLYGLLSAVEEDFEAVVGSLLPADSGNEVGGGLYFPALGN